MRGRQIVTTRHYIRHGSSASRHLGRVRQASTCALLTHKALAQLTGRSLDEVIVMRVSQLQAQEDRCEGGECAGVGCRSPAEPGPTARMPVGPGPARSAWTRLVAQRQEVRAAILVVEGCRLILFVESVGDAAFN